MLRKTETASLIITASLWVIFGICAIFIPISKKEEPQKFISVKITLPAVEKVEKEVEPPKQQANLEQVVKQDIVQEKTVVPETPKQEVAPKTETPVKTQPKPEQKTTTSTPKKELAKTVETPVKPSTPVKQELQQSMEDAIAAQNANKSKKTVEEVDWDAMFGSSSVTTNESSQSSKSQVQKVLDNQQALVGEAGTSSSNDSSVVASSKSQNTENSASTNTSSMLQNIATKEYVSSNSSFSSVVNIEGKTDVAGGTLIQLEDGKMRKLIFPSEPKITLSETSKIETSVNVKIEFLVLKDGSVTNIKINNEALITLEIVSEIKNQVSKWRFDKSDSDGHGHFNYSIIKK